MEGWVKIHRKTLENPIICKDSDYLSAWIYLLLNATHKELPAIFKGKKITLKPGQLLTGRKTIARELKLSESKVKRILIDFENDQQIERQRSNLNSLITIVNWNKYQENDRPIGQPTTSQRPANDQPMTTNKNVNNEINNILNNNILCSEEKEIQEAMEKVNNYFKGRYSNGGN